MKNSIERSCMNCNSVLLPNEFCVTTEGPICIDCYDIINLESIADSVPEEELEI